MSCRDGSNSGLGEQAGSCFGDQFLEQRLMLGGLGLQIPGSPRDLPQHPDGDAGLNVASRGAKRSARGHEVFAFESNQAFANWLRGTHDQGIELVQCLAVGADRTLPGAEQNPNRLSIAALSRNRVMFSSQGFASDLDSVQLV